MLSYLAKAVGFGGQTEEEKRDRQKEEDKQFEAQEKARLARAMKVHNVEEAVPYTTEDQKSLVTKEEVEGVPEAFVLHNVLTPEECDFYINFTEKLEYTDAPVTTGVNSASMMPDVRDNSRVMWEVSEGVTRPIWSRIHHLIPEEITMNYVYRVDESNPLNNRFRFYKYDLNQQFKPHFDGCYKKNGQEFSHFTFIIYLNDGFEGGETVFFPKGLNSLWTTRVTNKESRVNPKKGSALVFRHTGKNSPLHEGAPHFSEGKIKYVLRYYV